MPVTPRLSGMAKKKRKDEVQDTIAPSELQSFLLPFAHAEALRRYFASKKPPPSKASVFRLGLEMFLEHEGFWPPEDEPQRSTSRRTSKNGHDH